MLGARGGADGAVGRLTCCQSEVAAGEDLCELGHLGRLLYPERWPGKGGSG